MSLNPLPIDDVLPEIVSGLRQRSNLVLQAATGAGKTTRVPPALLDAGIAGEGAILVLQPRRIAARATAARMAQERGSHLGSEVGFQTRFESRVGKNTRVFCITEGILLRRLLSDPFLDGVSTIVFDEFHERNLASDLALGMVRQMQLAVRPELHVIVMSATLDPIPIAAYLGDCPAITSKGRTFPVAIEYASRFNREPVAERAAWGVDQLLNRIGGDLLVFLPGVGEIRAAAKLLQNLTTHNIRLHELYGELSPEQQDAVLRASDRRKVILATNVAETSLTIDGIEGVIDTGLARQLRYDDASGLNRLELAPISQAAAAQRAGRAGRTCPGICLRLWPEAMQRSRPEREMPEIHRVDLSGAALQLQAWIEPDSATFPWFEAPRTESLTRASHLLERLGAVNERRITPLGRAMSQLPLAPRLARMLAEGARLRQVERVAIGAALLSERNPFERMPGASRRAHHTSESDLLDQISALETFRDTGATATDAGVLRRDTAQNILRTAAQLVRQLEQAQFNFTHDGSCSPNADEAVLRAALSGFPDRLARRREIGSRRAVMVGGRGVRLAETSAVDRAALFVCLDVDAGQGEAVVRQASAVEATWLPADLLETGVDVYFDEQKQRVAARRRVMWDDLTLEESPAQLPSGEAVALTLAAAALDQWETVDPLADDKVASFLARLNFLQEAMPNLDLPIIDTTSLQNMLPTVCAGRRALAEIQAGAWLDAIKVRFTYQQLQTIDREAPLSIAVPSGSSIAITYQRGQRPVLAVRIQEMFGLAETPRIAGKRVPLLLHLLAPNYRPQQITDDLQSFWNNTYQQVRKDLRGRYPKHSWPEDPWTAPPQKRPPRRS